MRIVAERVCGAGPARRWRATVAHASVVLTVFAGFAVTAASTASASVTFTVNSTADAPDANPGDGVCATRVGRVCTLRAAIQETNALSGTDTINLATKATYKLTLTGTGEDHAATGDLDITSPVTINGNGAVIDGQAADRVFEIYSTRTDRGKTSLKNLTVQNGKTPETGYGGGGIFVRSGGLLGIVNSTVENNRSLVGGGVAADSGSVVTISSSKVSGNTAYVSGSFGGSYGGVLSSGILTITNSTISANHAVDYAAGIYSDGSLTITGTSVTGNDLTNIFGSGVASGVGLGFVGTALAISGSTFSNNLANALAGAGGGMEIHSGTGTVSGTTVSGNSSFDGAGISNDGGSIHFSGLDVHDNHAGANAGGISFNNATTSATLDTSKVHDNTAGSEGGGITVANGATLTASGSAITNNTAGTDTSNGFGGGIATSFPVATTKLTVTASTIAGNHATHDGGGVYNGRTAVFKNVTISGNTADHRGGGLYNSAAITMTSTMPLAGVATLTNTTVADNTSTAGAGLYDDAGRPLTLSDTLLDRNSGGDCAGTITSTGHNFDADSTCAVSGAGDLSGMDPLLGSLGDNGGDTPTQALGLHSPAVDAGDPSTCMPTDQRSVARPQDGDLDGTATCDIGAYELVPSPPGPPTLTSVASGDRWVTVAWDPPPPSEALRITSYIVTTSPGGQTVTVPAAARRAVVTVPNGTTQTAHVQAVNAKGPGTASAESAPFTPTAAAVSVTTHYDASDNTRLLKNATYFGQTAVNAQRTSVGILAYLVGLVGPPAMTPIPPPASPGPNSYTTAWSTGDQPALVTVMRQYGLTPPEAQLFSVQIVGYLLALGGN